VARRRAAAGLRDMAASFDVCVIGHVARDINAIGGVELQPSPGGAAYYSTMVYRRLGLRAAVVTLVAAADAPLLQELNDAGVIVFNLPTEVTTTFRNEYPVPHNLDLRVQRVDTSAGTISAAALPELNARIWHIGPLTETDVDVAMIADCAERGGLVGMDVQGLTRVVIDGEVRARAPVDRMDYLRHVDVLKADDAEILTYTGASDIATAVTRVHGAGAREILVTHASAGATIYGPHSALQIAAVPPRRSVDTTGCGDTFLAAYLTRRLSSDDLRECGEFAAAAAAINIEAVGAFSGTAAGIAERRAALRRQT
jgi:sugar/nucleoside kinase (ribokinase family)